MHLANIENTLITVAKICNQHITCRIILLVSGIKGGEIRPEYHWYIITSACRTHIENIIVPCLRRTLHSTLSNLSTPHKTKGRPQKWREWGTKRERERGGAKSLLMQQMDGYLRNYCQLLCFSTTTEQLFSTNYSPYIEKIWWCIRVSS